MMNTGLQFDPGKMTEELLNKWLIEAGGLALGKLGFLIVSQLEYSYQMGKNGIPAKRLMGDVE